MAEVSLVQCDCGLVMTSPRPTPEALGQYYPLTYYSYLPKAPTRSRQILTKLRDYEDSYPVEDGPVVVLWQTAAFLFGNFFLFYLPYRGLGKRLLEVGCGIRSDLEWARQRGWDFHGSELSESAVQIAKKQGLDVQCSTFESANLASNSFDCIIISQVLEHLYSPKLALERCHKLLRPGGLRCRSSIAGPDTRSEISGTISVSYPTSPLQSISIGADDSQCRVSGARGAA